MDIKNPTSIKQASASCLREASYNPRRLVLIHSGAAFAFSLALTIVNFVVSRQIGNTGGLSGLGLRSILSTIQTVLQYASSILMPFWQIGFVAAVLAIARKQTFGPNTLLSGFRRFSAVLGMLAAEMAVIIGVAFVCIYLCSAIYVATPLSQPFLEILAPALEEGSVLSGGEIYLDEATLAAATEAMLPMMVLALGLCLVVMLPISYHFRMAELILMDEPRCGGLRALLTSVKLMRRNCLRLLKLDIRFWWFYVLQGLTIFIGYADMILPVFGVELPMDAQVAFFAFYILHIITQLALHIWAKPMLQTSYALFYDSLRSASAPQQEKPAPKKLPWDYQ